MRDLKFKMTQPQKGEKLVRIYLGGDLGVSNLPDFMPKLKSIEKDFSEFEINLNDVDVMDLATLQVLISFKKACERHKKEVKFKLDLPKEISDLFEITGLSKIIKQL